MLCVAFLSLTMIGGWCNDRTVMDFDHGHLWVKGKLAGIGHVFDCLHLVSATWGCVNAGKNSVHKKETEHGS